MLIKVVYRCVLFIAVVLLAAYPLAWIAPVTYLKLEAFLGFGPVSMSWAVSHAQERMVAGTYDYCGNPLLFAWYGSFGGGPYLPDDMTPPARESYKEIILINSGIIWESTELALKAMASFNEEMIKQCFGSDRG